MPPGGWSRGLAEPEARSVQETFEWGRRVTYTWFDPPFRPDPPHSSQAYGICFTEAGLIVLGAGEFEGRRYVNLLGGGVEPGETLEDCLVREVAEEGCARVVESRLPRRSRTSCRRRTTKRPDRGRPKTADALRIGDGAHRQARKIDLCPGWRRALRAQCASRSCRWRRRPSCPPARRRNRLPGPPRPRPSPGRC
jgi:hypothetical protein